MASPDTVLSFPARNWYHETRSVLTEILRNRVPGTYYLDEHIQGTV